MPAVFPLQVHGRGFTAWRQPQGSLAIGPGTLRFLPCSLADCSLPADCHRCRLLAAGRSSASGLLSSRRLLPTPPEGHPIF